MNSIFTLVEKQMELIARFNAAKDAGDTEGMAQVKEAQKAQDESRNALDAKSLKMYRMYLDARTVGNNLIDLHDVSQYRNEAELIATFREFGIKEFTFSSSWSSAVESAWEFTKNGCTQQGMVEVFSHVYSIDGDGYEKHPAFLFKVN